MTVGVSFGETRQAGSSGQAHGSVVLVAVHFRSTFVTTRQPGLPQQSCAVAPLPDGSTYTLGRDVNCQKHGILAEDTGWEGWPGC